MSCLNKYKELTMDVCRKKKWDNVPIENLWMYLTEEVGELASAIRRNTNQFSDGKKTNIQGEIMDVMSYLFQIADVFDIDLDEAFDIFLKSKQNKNSTEYVFKEN